MTMPKFIKRPVAIEAYQLPPLNAPPQPDLVEFLGGSDRVITSERDGTMAIETLEGVMTASPMDYVIKGVAGEYYPCKPDIFEATYYTEQEYAELKSQ
jgi:hypothetical protein